MCDHCSCRELPPIAELSAEHEEILRVAWDICEHDRLSGAVDPAQRAELVAMLDVHVEAEESALYPLLVAGGDLAPEDAAALEAEHDSLMQALAGGSFDRRAYFELAAHIEHEEMELFPAAMFGFDDDAWERLAATPRFVGAGVSPQSGSETPHRRR